MSLSDPKIKLRPPIIKFESKSIYEFHGDLEENSIPDRYKGLFHSFFTEISSSRTKQQASAQLISSAASQIELKAENKHKLLFNRFPDKLFFQQAEALPNRAKDREAFVMLRAS
jgi:hypothetical protein